MPANDSSRPRNGVALAAIICLVLALVAAASVYQTRQLQAQLQLTNAELERLKTKPGPARLSSEDPVLLRKLLQAKEDAYHQLQTEYDQFRAQSAGAGSPSAGEAAMEPAAGAVVRAPAPAGAAVNVPGAATGRSLTWLERLKQQDPARYQQLQQDRERRRQQVTAPFTEQYEHVDEQLVAAQTDDEATLLNQLAETMAKASDLRTQWQSIRELPEAQRREQAQQLMTESRETYQQLVDLQGKNRQMQFQQLATQVGYNDSKVAGQFVDSVNQIINQTDTSWNRVMGFSGRGMRGATGTGGTTPNPTTQPTPSR